MKKILLAALAIALSLSIQAQKLPQPSPTASFTEMVGLTEISMTYSRPSMKDRAIFGELVPFGELWRTGANLNSTISLSTDATIGGEMVKAGTYSIFTIPGESEWTIILNSKTDHGGTSGYSEDNDVARFMVKPSMLTESVETFSMGINNIMSNGAHLVISWENTTVHIPIMLDVNAAAQANIDAAIAESSPEDLWKVYRNAASYKMNNEGDVKKALEYITMSTEANDANWYSFYLQASIQSANDMKKEAKKSAKKAMKIGQEDAKKNEKEFGYADMVQEAIDKYSSKD